MQINNKNQNLDMIPFVTTKKQSETIISCGVDPITADLSYIVFPNGHLQYYVGQHKMQATNFCIDGVSYGKQEFVGEPAWSSSALLALLPKKINIDGKDYEGQLCLCNFGYEFRYISKDGDFPFGTLQKDPVSACVEAIKWLHEEKHQLNNIFKELINNLSE
jgi:hypothetical protein